jgi:hypothetical protein
VSVIRAVKDLESKIKDDMNSIRLMRKIKKQGESNVENIRQKHQEELDKLIQYGMVNLLINNEVVISGIGLQVLKSLENRIK